MTIHLVGLPHTQLDDKEFSFCAFTAKAARTARMMRATGRDVITYWGGDKADVSLMSRDEQATYFGEYTATSLPSIVWDASLPCWLSFNNRAIAEITRRIKPLDIIAIVGGAVSQMVVDHFKSTHTCIEPGVGYEGICKDTFACFESYAWMHHRYGANWIGDGRFFDAVIPNAVDPDEWVMDNESDGYALFVGRLISRKGPHAAATIANAAGLKLVLAGGGVKAQGDGWIEATDGTRIEGDVEHVGAFVGLERQKLFAKAEVFICPTIYIGPWEGVHAESQMSGVGVAAPDYGVFTESLPAEYRYRNLSQAVRAVNLARETRGEFWRDRAIKMFSIERCTELYDDWLDRLESLRDGRNGWYG